MDFSWAMSDGELKKQLDNYHTLKMTESYRGISVLIILILLAIGGLLSFFFDIFNLQDILISLILYLPISFFVYKGHRWAIVILMILWTFERAYSVYILENIWPIIWWAVIIPYFYKALKVENVRRKQ